MATSTLDLSLSVLASPAAFEYTVKRSVGESFSLLW